MQTKNLKHRKIAVGALPLIDQVLSQLGFRELLVPFMKNQRYINAVEVMLKSILVDPGALYRIPEWSRRYAPQYVCGGVSGDDILGRALDRLFETDRATLQTKLTISTVNNYNVDTSIVHNDSTSIKFHGAYKKQSSRPVRLALYHLAINSYIFHLGKVSLATSFYPSNKTHACVPRLSCSVHNASVILKEGYRLECFMAGWLQWLSSQLMCVVYKSCQEFRELGFRGTVRSKFL